MRATNGLSHMAQQNHEHNKHIALPDTRSGSVWANQKLALCVDGLCPAKSSKQLHQVAGSDMPHHTRMALGKCSVHVLCSQTVRQPISP